MDETRRSVLIVDDEPLNLLLIGEYLKVANQGFTWDMVENGKLALQKLQATPDAYDVVLLDCMMPEMDGFEVLAKIQNHPILKHVPVIMQSARALAADVKEGKAAGATYYLTKPFKQTELMNILKAAMTGGRE